DYTWDLISGTIEAPGLAATGSSQIIVPTSPLVIDVYADNASGACTAMETITVDVSMWSLSGVVIDENCVGNDGSIDLEPLGGVGPFTYAWVPGGAAQDLTGIVGGNYAVTVTDLSLLPTCMRDTIFVVGTTPPPSGTITGDLTICEGDCADITFNLIGTADFTVTLVNMTTGVAEAVPLAQDQATWEVCPTETTVYQLQSIVDGNTPSCSYLVTSDVTITVKPAVTATFIAPATPCAGDVINLEIDIDQPGNFDITYTDIDGVQQIIVATDGDVIPVTVADPSVTLSIDEIAYQTAPLCPNITVETLVIDVDPLPTAAISGGTTICAGEDVVLDIDLTGTGPWDVTYTENAGAPIVMNIALDSFAWLIAGGPALTTEYCITHVLDLGTNCEQDVNSCTEIVVNTLPTGSIGISGTICAGDDYLVTLDLTGNGPFDVVVEDTGGNPAVIPADVIDEDTFTVSPGLTETYCLISILDDNLCETVLNSCVTVTVNPNPTVDITGVATICAGACHDIVVSNMTGSGPFNLDWELRATDDDALLDNGTALALNNLDAIQVCPIEDAYVIITSITDSSVPTCSAVDPAGQFDITVNLFSTVSVSQDSAICLGGTPLLTFCFENYDPADIFSLDIGNASAFNVPAGALNALGCFNFSPIVDPIVNTTYTIDDFQNDNNACTQVIDGDVVISVTDVPTATLDANTTICPGTDATLIVTIPSTGGPFDITVVQGSTGDEVDYEGIVDQFTFDVSPAVDDTYEIILIADSTTAAACSSNPASQVTVDLFAFPTIVDPVDTLCVDTGEEFQISFELQGGDPSTYLVNPTLGNDPGGVLTALAPYIFTSGVLVAGANEVWEISDNSGCPPVELVIDAFTCPVLTYSGTIDVDPQFICSDALLCANANADEFLDGNDVLSFVITDDADFDAAVVYYISDSNCWDVAADLDLVGTLTFGTQYYVVAVAGNDIGNGLVDLGNPNISVSEPMPITFVETPTATISLDDTICADEMATLTVDLTGTISWNFEIFLDGVPNGMIVADQATTPYTVDVNTAGTYSIDYVNNTTCVGSTAGTAVITVNPLPTALLSNDGEICVGGNWDFDLDLTGTGPWDVVLEYDDGLNPPVLLNLDAVAAANTLYNVTADGTYTVIEVSDANGCENAAIGLPATLVVNDLPTAVWDFSDSSFCALADIDLLLTVTGAFPVDVTYTVDGGADIVITSIDGSLAETIGTPGQYCITQIDDDNTCTAASAACIDILEIQIPDVDAGPDVSVCSHINQVLGTVGDPLLDYEWTGDFTIIDNNSIAQPTANGLNNTPGLDVYNLTLTVSDTDCSAADNVAVTILPEPIANAGADVEICYDEEYELTATLGANYLWEDNGWFTSALDIANPTVQPLVNDEFVVTVIGANLCEANDTIFITVPVPYDVTVVSTPEVCFGICDAIIDVTVDGSYGDYVIAWDNIDLDDFDEVDVCAGIYEFTVLDSNFCSYVETVDVAEIEESFIDDVLITTPNCFGDETGVLEILEPTGTSYIIDNPADTNVTGVFNGLAAGIYNVLVEDVNGCWSDTAVVFMENSPEIFIASIFDTIFICVDTPIDFIANAGGGDGLFDYVWYDDVPPGGLQLGTGNTLTLSPLDELTVYILAIDGLGCSSDTLQMSAVFDTPVTVVTDPNGEPQICQGECLDMAAITEGGSGNIDLNWVEYDIFNPIDLGSNVTITECPIENTAYIIYADDGCSVIASDTVFVIVHETPEILFEANTFGGCYPVTVMFVNQTDTNLTANCLWDFGTSDLLAICDTVSYTYNNPGEYYPSLTVTSDEGCSNTGTSLVPIQVYDYPIADFTWEPVPVTTLEYKVQFINQSINAETYNWDISGFAQTSLIDPYFEFPSVDLANYIVCLEAINQFGCTDTICKDIEMESILLVHVPNAFTPDQDGLNDTFFPVILGISSEYYVFRIWDRWGRIVFETTELEDVWTGGVGVEGVNGTHFVPNDVYIWEVECQELATGEIRNLKGHVTIVR
ncbi:MAG: gliding motility-associated-like protein, partial [Litorivivens sp.]